MKPFLHGKKNLGAPALSAPRAKLIPAIGGATAPGPHAPHVEVVKEGDKVTRLVVVCTCGERIEVECLYRAGA